MSDSEYSYEYSTGDEGSGAEDGGAEDDGLIEIENTFCEAEEIQPTDAHKAMGLYDRVVELERQRNIDVNFSFKSLRATVTIAFELGDLDDMVRRYERMLELVDRVSSNESNEGINYVLDQCADCQDSGMLRRMYEITLDSLRSARSERLLFSINVRKAKLHLAAGEYNELVRLIRDLHKSCQLPDGTDDKSKSTHLMDVYALEIQLCEAKGDRARMKEIFPKVKSLPAAIADPRVLGVVNESFGKMLMSEEAYFDAYNLFFDAFRHYQEGGRQENARKSLKYLMLAYMLSKRDDINPMETREAKVFKDDPEIRAMDRLRLAYADNNISQFEDILADEGNAILDDEFVHLHLADLLATVRSVALLKIVRPYTTVRLSFLASELRVSVEEVESLAVRLLLDGSLEGSIDQVEGCLRLGNAGAAAQKTYASVAKWTESLEIVRRELESRLA